MEEISVALLSALLVLPLFMVFLSRRPQVQKKKTAVAPTGSLRRSRRPSSAANSSSTSLAAEGTTSSMTLLGSNWLDTPVQTQKVGTRWKWKGAKAKALANPISRTVFQLQSSLIQSDTQGFLLGRSVLLVLDVDQSNLINDACFGQARVTIQKDKQYIDLCMEEAFYLRFSLKCINIVGKDGCIISDEELWNHMVSQEESFPDLFKAYSHLRTKNWIVRPGSLRYGVDFVAYRHHPSLVHSEYSVIVLSDGDDASTNSRLRVWSDYHGTLRLCSGVAKTLLVLYVNRNGKDAASPSCLEGYSIEERTISRWNPEQSREDQSTVE